MSGVSTGLSKQGAIFLCLESVFQEHTRLPAFIKDSASSHIDPPGSLHRPSPKGQHPCALAHT